MEPERGVPRGASRTLTLTLTLTLSPNPNPHPHPNPHPSPNPDPDPNLSEACPEALDSFGAAEMATLCALVAGLGQGVC